MRKFDLSLRSSRSSYFATFRHQLTILSKTDALDEEKWLNMLGTFVKDWFRYESDSSEISESVNFCVMEAIKLCRLDTPIIFIEARINLSRFVVTGCAAKTSATVTFPSLNLISLFAFCFNIWLNGVAS